jgi:hypothetical protein
LTTASLIGLAVSPIVSGLLGATSIRAVFGLDVVTLAALAMVVMRVTGSGAEPDDSPRERGTEAVSEDPVVSETF